MRKSLVFILMFMFLIPNIVLAEGVVFSRHTSLVGKIHLISSVGMSFYYIQTGEDLIDTKYTMIGAAGLFTGALDECLYKSNLEGSKVTVSGILEYWDDNSMGFDETTVTCKPYP